MIDFVKYVLLDRTKKHQVSVLSNRPLNPQREPGVKDEDFKVVRVVLKSDINSKYVSCHSLLFPFQVQFCHYLAQTRLYEVTLESTRTKGSFATNIAVCHTDTRQWDLYHMVFKILGGSPGDFGVCHWSKANAFAFVAQDS